MRLPCITFPLVTEHLLIRPMKLDDARELLEVYQDAETMQHLTADLPTDVAGARELVQRNIDLYAADGHLSLWTVIHRATDRIVG